MYSEAVGDGPAHAALARPEHRTEGFIPLLADWEDTVAWPAQETPAMQEPRHEEQTQPTVSVQEKGFMPRGIDRICAGAFSTAEVVLICTGHVLATHSTCTRSLHVRVVVGMWMQCYLPACACCVAGRPVHDMLTECSPLVPSLTPCYWSAHSLTLHMPIWRWALACHGTGRHLHAVFLILDCMPC